MPRRSAAVELAISCFPTPVVLGRRIDTVVRILSRRISLDDGVDPAR